MTTIQKQYIAIADRVRFSLASTYYTHRLSTFQKYKMITGF